MRYATSSAAGAGSAVLGWVSTAGPLISMTARSRPSSRDRRPAVVTTADGAASASMNSTRGSGSAGSIGRYAAPALSTDSIAMIASAERSNSNATHRPGPTPPPANRCANRLAASSSSRYVSKRPSKLTATASGARATCAANNTGTDTPAAPGSANTARLPIASRRACSSASSRSIDDNRRTGSVVIATSTRCNRSINVWMLAGSNTSVRNSTSPPIPAGSPASVQRSAKKRTGPCGRCGCPPAVG